MSSCIQIGSISWPHYVFRMGSSTTYAPVQKSGPSCMLIFLCVLGLFCIIQYFACTSELDRHLMMLSKFFHAVLQKSDSSWKKSNTHYVATSYIQPLLLWTGAILICRCLDVVFLWIIIILCHIFFTVSVTKDPNPYPPLP